MGTPCEAIKSDHALTGGYTDQNPTELLLSPNTLAVFTFGGEAAASKDPRLVHTGLQQLGSASPKHEVWTSNETVNYGTTHGVNWASTSELLLCSVVSNESARTLDNLSQSTYEALLNVTSQLDYPHLLRAWNYIEGVNIGLGDSERYKQFCLGRHTAFQNHSQHKGDASYPAASAVGHHANPLTAYILAAKQPGKHFENPEQVSAYRYPRKYGPKSPSFARATLSAGRDCVYISGTASIKGHETLHPNDTAAQLAVTFDNISQLLEHVAQGSDLAKTPIMNAIKVYIRQPEDLEIVRTRVSEQYPNADIIYVQGDICRSDLNVEIDGTCYLK